MDIGWGYRDHGLAGRMPNFPAMHIRQEVGSTLAHLLQCSLQGGRGDTGLAHRVQDIRRGAHNEFILHVAVCRKYTKHSYRVNVE